MKTIQRLTLCALFALCALYANAYDFIVDGICYNIISSDELTCEVTYHDDPIHGTLDGEQNPKNQAYYTGSLIIPEVVKYSNKNYAVVGIDGFAFECCSNITSLTIPSSITTIENYAFCNCSGLTELKIPESVTSIGSSAFYFCTSLTEVNIPNSVTSIENYTFYYCSSLTEITIPNSVTSIGNHAFYGCSNLKEITIPNGVTKIEDYTFGYCEKLSCLVLGSSVERLGEYIVYVNNGALIKLYSLNPTPPICYPYTFSSFSCSKCVLYVPEEAVEAYSIAPAWRDFDIQGIETNGIEALTHDGRDVVGYYSIDGKRLNSSQRGINIVKYSDGTTKKVIIKSNNN